MTNEENSTTTAMSPDERARLKKQMSDHAVKLAVGSNWDEAARVNKEYVRVFPEDADGFNRLGKALTELGKIKDARDAYGNALRIDPTNTIARRNLDRLGTMKDSAAAAAAPSQVDPRLFVEETGKAGADSLAAVDTVAASELDAGDVLQLKPEGNAINVYSLSGKYIGMVSPRIGLRLARLIAGGNEYTAAVISNHKADVRIIIRETFQHPSQIDRVSFPQDINSENRVRPDIRRSVTRHSLSDDTDYSEDDEVVEDEEEPEEDRWNELSDDSGDLRVDTSSVDDEDNFD